MRIKKLIDGVRVSYNLGDCGETITKGWCTDYPDELNGEGRVRKRYPNIQNLHLLDNIPKEKIEGWWENGLPVKKIRRVPITNLPTKNFQV